ncbi:MULTISPECIES: hypothetical protein [unclassified Sphingobacterium]|uniref:hypothetical protein n=1 Tax=unclassified Sphingobacterium TaxID=2609468 RepID=UPI001053EDBB|nr:MULTISPECIES: hypothetical protein [unclassified Sphingobacterium]MCS3552674.1 hypothetical protein [Sphingobacterium sp. JUb21]TCR10567.1 hypothetical protein EDF66_101381 [Sphingobacterium sp. JUb20]
MMKRSTRTMLCLMAGIVVLASCKKELVETLKDNQNQLSSIRSSQVLNFSTAELKNYFDHARSQDASGVKKLKASSSGGPEGFSSLGALASTDPNAQMLVSVIDDNYMEDVLNGNGEIVVSDVLYKVTPYGTFFAGKNNTDNLNKMYASIASAYPITTDDDSYKRLDLTAFMDKNADLGLGDEVVFLKDNIGFIPTFVDDKSLNLPTRPNRLEGFMEDEADTGRPTRESRPDDGTTRPSRSGDGTDGTTRPSRGGDGTGGTRPPREGGGTTVTNGPRPSRGGDGTPRPPRNAGTPVTSSNELDPAMFENLVARQMNNPEGKILKTIFENSTEYNYFDDSDYRTSVLLYNRNYGFARSVGIKVKQQKAGGFFQLGIWGKVNAEEIVAGWTAVEFETLDLIPPMSLTSDAWRSFTDPTWNKPDYIPVYKAGDIFQILVPYDIPNIFPIGPDNIAGEFKINEKTIKPLLKLGWDALKKKLETPGGGKVKTINVKDGTIEEVALVDLDKATLGLIYKKVETAGADGKVKCVLMPYAAKEYNQDKIEKEFAFAIQDFEIKVSTDFTNIKFDPKTLDNLKKSIKNGFKFTRADVFGASKRNGAWRGVRVYTK